MTIIIERRWHGWLARVNGVYGYSRQSGCEAIGNALVYHAPGVTVVAEPARKPSWLTVIREIYWLIRKSR